MRVYNSFVLTVAAALLLTTVVLAGAGATLRAYYSLYVLEALAVSQVFAHFSASARRGLSLVSAGLLFGFLGVALSEVVRILAWK